MLIEKAVKNSTIDNQDNILKSNPFAYFNSKLFPDYEESLKKKIESLKITDHQPKEENLVDQIENKIKQKHNFMVPAITIEFKKGEYNLEVEKEDLKKFFSSLGEIEHIEINSKVAHVLYKHFFSALYAYDLVKEIIEKENKKQLNIKIITKEEEEDKNNSEAKRQSLQSQTDLFHSKVFSQGSNGVTPTSSRNFEKTKECIDNEEIKISNCPGNSFLPNYNYYSSLQNFSINFHTVSNKDYLLKYVCNYDVQIDNEEDFMVTKKIIGNKGLFLKKIIYDSCIRYNDHTTKVRLRGRGSGYKEGPSNVESEDPLQLCISSLNYFTYTNCCRMIEAFLYKIYMEYSHFCQSKYSALTEVKQIVKYEFVVNRYPSSPI